MNSEVKQFYLKIMMNERERESNTVKTTGFSRRIFSQMRVTSLDLTQSSLPFKGAIFKSSPIEVLRLVIFSVIQFSP